MKSPALTVRLVGKFDVPEPQSDEERQQEILDAGVTREPMANPKQDVYCGRLPVSGDYVMNHSTEEELNANFEQK